MAGRRGPHHGRSAPISKERIARAESSGKEYTSSESGKCEVCGDPTFNKITAACDHLCYVCAVCNDMTVAKVYECAKCENGVIRKHVHYISDDDD